MKKCNTAIAKFLVRLQDDTSYDVKYTEPIDMCAIILANNGNVRAYITNPYDREESAYIVLTLPMILEVLTECAGNHRIEDMDDVLFQLGRAFCMEE